VTAWALDAEVFSVVAIKVDAGACNDDDFEFAPFAAAVYLDLEVFKLVGTVL
jgi:Ni,Fe-hydrogenase III small subunit